MEDNMHIETDSSVPPEEEEIIINLIINLIEELKGLKTEVDQLVWINEQRVDSNILIRAFNTAIINGFVEIVKILSKMPEAYNVADHRDAIEAAAQYGHLEVVKFLHTLDATGDNDALILATAGNHLDVVDFLSSLPCYNPFNQNITAEKKGKTISELTNFNLQNKLNSYLLQSNLKSGFLFLNGSTMDEIPLDVRKKIAAIALELDHSPITSSYNTF